MMSDSIRRWRAGFLAAALVGGGISATSCGYHEVGHANALPATIRTIAIPAFASHSQTFRIEQLLTDAVVREFDTRTQFKVIHDTHQDADAVLKGTVLSATAAPWRTTPKPAARLARSLRSACR